MEKILPIIVCFSFIWLSGCIEETSIEDTNDKPFVNNMIYVDDDGGQNFTNIQRAIENASAEDIIYVYSGIYNETITINKSITLLGDSENKPIIFYERGEYNTTNIIQINANNCTLNGFEIQASSGFLEVIGISISSSNNIISNNTIMNTTRGINIGPEVENNTIKWNIFSFNANAIRVQDAKKNTIYRNVISFNDRGVLLCCGSISNLVYLNTFKNNSVWHGYDLFHNKWNNDSVGNFWDDYIGNDNDQDGIGNIPYNITGGVSQDNYPLITPLL